MSDPHKAALTYATTLIDPILIATGATGEITSEDGRIVVELDHTSDDEYADLRDALERTFKDVDEDAKLGFTLSLDPRMTKEIETGLPTKGFHVLDDTAFRATVVAHFDGTVWWMPGSDQHFTTGEVMGPDGSNAGGRFNRRQFLDVGRGGADWDAGFGRVA